MSNYNYNNENFCEIDELELLRENHRLLQEQARLKRKNDIKKKRRRRNIIATKRNWYNPSIGWVKYNPAVGENNTRRSNGEYVVYPKNSKKQRYLKNQSARRNRRRPIDEEDRGNKGNSYKRALDYDWELW